MLSLPANCTKYTFEWISNLNLLISVKNTCKKLKIDAIRELEKFGESEIILQGSSFLLQIAKRNGWIACARKVPIMPVEAPSNLHIENIEFVIYGNIADSGVLILLDWDHSQGCSPVGCKYHSSETHLKGYVGKLQKAGNKIFWSAMRQFYFSYAYTGCRTTSLHLKDIDLYIQPYQNQFNLIRKGNEEECNRETLHSYNFPFNIQLSLKKSLFL